MKFLRKLARIAGIALLTAVIFLSACQSKLMYYPRPYDAAVLKMLEHEGGQRIETRTSQGRQVAFYLPTKGKPFPQQPEFIWLVFGGNGSLVLEYTMETPRWDARFAYLFIDYPGYGLCEGSPNPARIEESIVALVGVLQNELHWSDAELRARAGVFGHSLGCAAGLIAADRLQLQRGVLCAPFTTMTDMARRVIGWPLCYLNRHRYDNIARLQMLSSRNFQCRIFHGSADTAIPAAMGRKLGEMFPQNARFTEVSGSDHNTVVSDAVLEIGGAMSVLSGLR